MKTRSSRTHGKKDSLANLSRAPPISSSSKGSNIPTAISDQRTNRFELNFGQEDAPRDPVLSPGSISSAADSDDEKTSFNQNQRLVEVENQRLVEVENQRLVEVENQRLVESQRLVRPKRLAKSRSNISSDQDYEPVRRMNRTPPQSKNITETAIEESDGPSSAVKFTNDSREDDSDDSEEVEIYNNTSDERNNLHMVPVASDLIERARCAFVLFFDGAAKNNPGRAGCGFVLYHRETKLAFCKGCAYLSEATNNEAEYEGILTGLKHAVDLGIKEISIYGDSQLVINQLTGVFQVSAENLRTGHQKGTDLLLQMMNYDLNHISRAANSEADALANQAIRFRQDRTTYYNSHGIAAPVVPLVVREAISAKVTKRVDVSPFRFSRSSYSRGSHSSSSSSRSPLFSPRSTPLIESQRPHSASPAANRSRMLFPALDTPHRAISALCSASPAANRSRMLPSALDSPHHAISRAKNFVEGFDANTLLLEIPIDKLGTLTGLNNSLTFIPEKLVKKSRKIHNMYLSRIRDHHESVLNWRKYHLLPVVICANNSLGKQRKEGISTRLSLLEADDWSKFTLGSLGLKPNFNDAEGSTRDSRDQERNHQDYAMKFAKAGEISKCLSVISSAKSRFPVDLDLVTEIQGKHPPAPPSTLNERQLRHLQEFTLPEDAASIVATPSFIQSAIRSSKSLVKHGLDKCRFEHLRQLLGVQSPNHHDADEATFLELYTHFVNLIISNRIPEEALQLFRNNEKWVVAKAGNDVSDPNSRPEFRPLEGTSVVRKIAGLAILQSQMTKEFTAEHFRGLQFSMEKNGTEKIVHAFRLTQDKHPERDMFFGDGDGAFNRLSRDIALHETMTNFPAIFPFVKAMYGGPSGAWIYGAEEGIQRINIDDGVTQGCSLGSLLYSIGTLPFVRGIQSRLDEGGDGNFTKFFVDDGNISADFDSMVRGIDYMIAEGPKYGYFLKRNKGCYMLGRCGDTQEAIRRKQFLIERYGFIPSLIHIHPDDAHTEEETEVYEKNYGAKLLGTWIGTDLYIRQRLSGKLTELASLRDDIVRFQDPQVRNLMFRLCFCQKVNYLQRTTSPSVIQDFIAAYEELKKDVFLSFVQSKYTKDSLPGRVWEQAQLHINDGGLGYQYASDTTPCAYVASILDSKDSLMEIWPDLGATLDRANTVDEDRDSLPLIREFCQALRVIQAKQSGPDRLDVARIQQMKARREEEVALNEEDAHDSRWRKGYQELLSRSLRPKRLERFLHSAESTKELAWLTSLASKDAGRWLECCPKSERMQFSPAKFIVLLFYRLQLPSPAIVPGTRCSCKRSPVLDLEGTHLTTGCGKDGHRHRLHDIATHTISLCARTAGVMTLKEEHGCFREVDPNTEVRPDLSFINVPGLHRKLVADTSITCPYPTGMNQLSAVQARRPLRAAADRFNVKMNKYSEIAERNNLEFLPFIIESTGRLHPKLIDFIDCVLRDKAQGDRILLGRLKRFWFTLLSCSIQNSLAESLLTRAAKINGRITSSMAGDYSLSDAFVDRFQYVNTR